MKEVPDGHNAVLKHIVDMFLELESEGVEIEIDVGETSKFLGSPANLSADNLALHDLIGLFEIINAILHVLFNLHYV